MARTPHSPHSPVGYYGKTIANERNHMTNRTTPAGIDRRGFLKLMAAGAAFTPLALAGCGSTQQAATAEAAASTGTAADLAGAKLTFVGDDAFAPYRYLEVQSDGSQKVVGLDIAIADEMANRLGFTYDFEPQEFAATLASVQSSDTSFTMAMSSNPSASRPMTSRAATTSRSWACSR